MVKKTYFYLIFFTLLLSCSPDGNENPIDAQIEVDNEIIKQYVADNQIVAERDASGFYYIPIKTNPDGGSISGGDIVSFRYKLSLLDGTVIVDKSHSSDLVQKARHNVSPAIYTQIYSRALNPAGIDLGLAYMKEGERYSFVIPSYLAFYDLSKAGAFPAFSNMIAEVEVVSIISKDQQEAIEKDSIDAYIVRKGLEDVQSLSSGLHYISTHEGSGSKAQSGQVVSVNYTGRLLDGTVFDKSSAGSPFSFQLGAGKVIPGWDEGIALMKEGEKGILMIPSHLAYRHSLLTLPHYMSDAGIPPFSVLIFDVELVEIR